MHDDAPNQIVRAANEEGAADIDFIFRLTEEQIGGALLRVAQGTSKLDKRDRRQPKTPPKNVVPLFNVGKNKK